MSKKLSLITCLGLAALASLVIEVAAQTGPVREGVRRTGEAAAEGTRAAIRGSREVIGRAGQATRQAVESTTDAARAQVDRAERSELRVNPNAETNIGAGTQAGSAQVQADANIDANQQLNAQGRMEGQLNESITNDRYESGFRGTEEQGRRFDQPPAPPQSGAIQYGEQLQYGDQVEYNGRLYSVRHDRFGRPFICVGRCRVYLDEQGSGAQSYEARRMSAESAPYNGVQPEMQPHQGELQGRQENLPGSTYAPRAGYAPAPAPPTPIRPEIESDNPRLESESQLRSGQSPPAEQNQGASGSASSDAGASASNGGPASTAGNDAQAEEQDEDADHEDHEEHENQPSQQ